MFHHITLLQLKHFLVSASFVRASANSFMFSAVANPELFSPLNTEIFECNLASSFECLKSNALFVLNHFVQVLHELSERKRIHDAMF